MRSQTHTSDWAERAQEIYTQINKIASVGSVRIGFTNSSAISHAVSEMKTFGFQKPFLAKSSTWLQQQILTNNEAYVLLSPNIRLEFIVNGRIAYWNGYGARIDYAALHDFAHKAGSWVLEKTSPIWVCINFGLNYQPFIGLLDDLNSEELK